MTSPVPVVSSHTLALFRQRRWSYLGFLFGGHFLFTALLFSAYLPTELRTSPIYQLRSLAFAGLLQLLLYLCIYVPLSFLPKLRPHRWIGALEGTRLLLTILDLILFSVMGTHLYSPEVLINIRHPRFLQDIGLSFWSSVTMLAALSGMFVLQWLLWRAWWWCHACVPSWLSKRRWPWWIGVLTTIGIVFGLHSTTTAHQRDQLQRYLPLYQQVNLGAYNRASVRRLRQHLRLRQHARRYPLHRMNATHTKQVQRPDIVLWLAETFRGDMFNPKDMPHLSAISRTQPTLVSTRHYSGGHQTWEGTFSLLYALYGHHRPTMLNQDVKPYPIQMLKQLGYRTIALTSGSLRYQGYMAMSRSFDKLVDLSHQDAIQGDRNITNRAIELFAKRRKTPKSKRKPLFLLMFYNASHYPYLFPKTHAAFKPHLPKRFNQFVQRKGFKQKLWNRYRNSVRYVDSEIARMYKALAPERKAKKLAWLFTGDHGEEFWDHGLFGHGARRLNDARIRVPLVMHVPGQAARRVSLSSHVDIFPTLFDQLGVTLASRHYSDGHSLVSNKARQPNYIHVNAYNFPRSPHFALITPQYKIFARRTLDMQLEVNQVYDHHDTAIRWQPAQIKPYLTHALKDIDRFYPDFKLWHSQQFRIKRKQGYPFISTKGPIRHAKSPQRRPWDRLGNSSDYISTTPPRMQYKRRIPLGPYIELVGYNLDAHRVKLGDAIRIEYIFRCIKTPPKHWELFFHFDLRQHPGWQNIGHTPIFNTYSIHKWKAGQYIRDPQQIPTDSEWRTGRAYIRIGLYNRRTRKRAPVPKALGKHNSAIVAPLTFH